MTITSWSEVPFPERCVVVFDLDDTLYPERDFVRSGFRAVSKLFALDRQTAVFEQLGKLFHGRHADPFAEVIAREGSSFGKARMIEAYRTHRPQISLAAETRAVLTQLRKQRHDLAIITDGRSATQRNKIDALELNKWVDCILVSEEIGQSKPHPLAYQRVEARFPGRPYCYVGNDIAKDFLAPNQLSWLTVGIVDDGLHVHPNRRELFAEGHQPQYWIHRLAL